MIKPPFTIEHYQRVEYARLAIKAIRNRAHPKHQAKAISLAVYILATVNQSAGYIRHNLGELRPIPCTTLFTHDSAQLQSLSKALENLQKMRALFTTLQRLDLQREFSEVGEYLKDLKSLIVYMMKQELEHGTR